MAPNLRRRSFSARRPTRVTVGGSNMSAAKVDLNRGALFNDTVGTLPSMPLHMVKIFFEYMYAVT